MELRNPSISRKWPVDVETEGCTKELLPSTEESAYCTKKLGASICEMTHMDLSVRWCFCIIALQASSVNRLSILFETVGQKFHKNLFQLLIDQCCP